jgi:hypothetical protein
LTWLEVEMDFTRRDPREMTDEKVMKWMRDLVNRSAEQKGAVGDVCSLEAIRSPVRRKILSVLAERALTINEISEKVGIAGATLRFHLNFLRSSCFVRIEGNLVDLTPGGVSIVRSKKPT